ncbi:penicillin acylase family protein [Ideonella livida]|uniref:Penicillin acylase family protein n=1 Tax=Ideonella livida TaxID=2707176 RepID=A0A7C9TM96_9BURK|nr:penicillin acylase family protein [Ideonella livida]NDY93024.1 penicillin acylase family protein [Ideonella livida]
MRRTLKLIAWSLGGGLLLVLMTLTLYLQGKRPQRDGELELPGLQAAVQVRYDELGVPHLQARHEADLYRALGYVHAQDRWFQMEMQRRLARGELAEVLGPKLLDTDKLFRTLRLREHADRMAARLDPASPAGTALQAYLDGVNHCVAHCPLPLEFDLLGLPRRPFTAADSYSVIAYLAFSFANALRTDPALTFIRDHLGERHLAPFLPPEDPLGALGRPQARRGAAQPVLARPALPAADHPALARLGELVEQASALSGVGLFEGSNAWVVGGSRTRSGKPLLAGDPHIGFSVPAVWYEAHLQAPGFELYGHFAALLPMALLGHNTDQAWSLTMFQNDDMDLVLEETDPARPGWLRHPDGWRPTEESTSRILVKGAPAVDLVLRRGPHGPLVESALPPGTAPSRPVALRWTLLETDNPVLEAFYRLNRASTLQEAREAAQGVHAPGLNILWAHARGDIGWWAAAKLPQRPAGMRPSLMLDAARGEARTLGWLPFSDNPQEENPARGYIVSANHAPASPWPLPGYYAGPHRVRHLDAALATPGRVWDAQAARELQLADGNGYAPEFIARALALLEAAPLEPQERRLLEQLGRWDGRHGVDSVEATLFNQWFHEIATSLFREPLGEAQLGLLLRARILEDALLRVLEDPTSPWWDRRDTPAVERPAERLSQSWRQALRHLETTFGAQAETWTWGRAHTLTHGHPLGRQAPLDRLFNVGPYGVPGGRETPNNFSYPVGPAPWKVQNGPSTRRVIELGDPTGAWASNPVGQSGVWGDPHYADQALAHAQGRQARRHLAAEDVQAHTHHTLSLRPAP